MSEAEDFAPGVVVIGASTGGPQAVEEVLSAMAGPMEAAILIVVHIRPPYSEALARRFDRAISTPVQLARDGEVLRSGTIRLAPAGFHLRLQRIDDSTVETRLVDEAPLHGCLPAVDPLFESAANCFGRRVLGVVLTGMGRDGSAGCAAIRQAGGQVIVQDEESSAVWGMPGEVQKRGHAHAVVELANVATEIRLRAGWFTRRRWGAVS